MFLFMLLGVLTAPLQRPVDVVGWKAVPVTATVPAGGHVTVQVTALVQQEWKLYALAQPAGGPKPLTFAIRAGTPYRLNSKGIIAPKAKVWKDENFDVQTQYYDGEVRFTVPVAVSAAAPAGRQTLPLDITFQACGQSICLRPYTQTLQVEIDVTKTR